MSSGNGGGETVVVTGIVGRLGRLLAQRLHRDGRWNVIGLDRRPFPDAPKDVEHVQADLRSKAAREVFRTRKVSTVIHLGVVRNPRGKQYLLHSANIGGTARLLDYCKDYGVPKVVVLSTANVYGPRPDNDQFLTEDAPLMGIQDFPAIRDLIEIDHLASQFFWKSPQTETVILRPVHVLGRVRNAPSNYLRLPMVPTLLGFDPMVQVIHERDVIDALACAMTPGVRGIFNITGPGELPLSSILRELARPTLPFPHTVARRFLGTLWSFGATTFPVPELDFIRYVCMVDGSRARRDLGFAPRFSLGETIRAIDAA